MSNSPVISNFAVIIDGLIDTERFMSKTYSFSGWSVTLGKTGAGEYTKMSYPLRYGRYDEFEDDTAVYQFNLNGDLMFAKGKGRQWPHPQEWLKRTLGNDWIYYSTGGYTGVFEAIGEYYLPNLQYSTNNLLGGKPFQLPCVKDITSGWHSRLLQKFREISAGTGEISSFKAKVQANTPQKLADKAQRLFQVTAGRVTVLPPDCRHVDYDIIPLTIASGCLYKCRFCKVKSAQPFREMTGPEIDVQLQTLQEIYADNLTNYNSVFLGEHDALCSSVSALLYGVNKANDQLKLSASYMQGINFFFFGSVGSLLNAPERLFVELSRLPCLFYINIGLESADQATLDLLGKPITSAMVEEAFARMQEINDRYVNIEMTANFVMDESLPANHYPGFLKLVRDSFVRRRPKGCVYLSPLKFDSPSRELVLQFSRLKLLSRVPTFLYTIQRL